MEMSLLLLSVIFHEIYMAFNLKFGQRNENVYATNYGILFSTVECYAKNAY